ncbi:MAG: PAS domain S-box protein, partial [Nostoc sp. ChiQUE01a]|nr:PAS domain S-box protein [Nostoc sp. ChiQUE01a]
GEWSIEAACELNADENACATQVLQSIPIADQLPESIIQYVIRTLKPVTLNDATREGAFINEPYIQQNQPQSIFCLPLLNQAKLVGVLYLENRLAVGVFTPERSQVLQLLSTQAAIAIENAKLYSELQAKESKITQFLEAIPVGIGIVDAAGRPYYTNQCGNQLTGKETDTSIAPEQISEAYQLYVAGTDQIYPAESLPIVRALRGERIRTEDIEIRRDHVTILIEARGTPVFDQQGNITYAIATFQDITERKQAEKLLADYNCTLEQQVAERTAALQRSEAKFRTIFENSQVGIYRVRLSDGLLLDANQRHANLFGFDSPEEIIGLEYVIGYYADPSDHQHLIELLKRDREVRSFEAQMRKRDGTLFWGLFSLYLNVDNDYIEGVIADISDRKQAEAALQNSEERLRLALTATNQGLYDLDLKTEERIVNPEYALMLGYNPATFHETISEWIARLHPDDRESVVATYHACITGEIPSYRAEYRQHTQNGQWKWTLSVGKIVAWDESGQPMRMLGTHVDINDRKQAEEALQASESKLRTLIEAIPDPLFVLTAEGRFLEIMVLERNLLWQPFEEMIGKTMHQLGREQADEFLGYIQQVLRTQQTLTVEYSAFLNGREAWFSARIAPIDHDQVIWLARDITALKQAEEASILEERNRMARE